MNNSATLSSSTFKFIFANIGIYFLWLFAVFMLFGLVFYDFEGASSFLLFLTVTIVLKNFLTYYALFSTRMMKYINMYSNLIFIFLIFDFFFIYFLNLLFDDIGIGSFFVIAYLSLTSVTFSIISLKLFQKIRNMQKTQKTKIILFSSIKLFCLILYFLTFPFVLLNIIEPMPVNIFVRIILLLFFTGIAVFVENIMALGLYIFFKLIKEYNHQLKERLLINYIAEFIVLFIIFLIFLFV